MPGWRVALLIAAAALLELGFILIVLRALMAGSFGRLSARYPRREPAPDAVRKNFQSFKFGLVNAGLSVHVAVDEHYLHLYPAAILRWAGVRAASVPWSAIQLKGKWGPYRRAKIDGIDISGPRWCLDLASPTSA